MPSNLDAIVEGIAAQLRTIPELKLVLTYEPDQPAPFPFVFIDMEGWDHPEKTTGEMTLGWDIVGYLVTASVTSKASAAATLSRQLVPAIIEAIGHDLHAHGAIVDGQVLLREATKGRRKIGDGWYYARRLTFRAIEMFPYQYAILEV
jgi:hypothetical protein